MQWVTSALQKPPHFHGHILVATVILTLQIQQLQSGLRYERETCNIKIPQEQVRHQEGILIDDSVPGFSLYILLLCCCFCSIKYLRSCFELRPSYLWLERVTSMAGNWTKSRTDHIRNYHRNHTASGSKPASLRTSQAAQSGSPPSHRPHCTPYGSFLTSKDRKKWSPSLRLNPLVPLKCGRVYDVSITSSAIPFFLHTKPEQCLTTLTTTQVGG